MGLLGDGKLAEPCAGWEVVKAIKLDIDKPK